MAQPETNSPSQGSVADVAARLALWGRRAAKGLARVEFLSDFSRQAVVTELRTALPQTLPLYEIELPFQQLPLDVVRFLLDRLRDLPAGIVSVTGFATAFSADYPLEDALRVLNFHREELAKFPLCQIWWMTSPFTDAFLRSIPDLDSWFLVRLNLSEVILDESVELLSTAMRDLPFTSDKARKQSATYVTRFEKAVKDNAPAEDLINLAFISTQTLAIAKLDGEEKQLAQRLLDRMIPTLQVEEVIEENTIVIKPNRSSVSIPHLSSLSRKFDTLAHLYESAGKIGEAEKFYQVALEMDLNSHNNFIRLSSAFRSIIGFYVRFFRFSEAEIRCKHWIEIAERMWAQDTIFTLLPMSVLFEIYLHGEKHKEAEQIFYRICSQARSATFDVSLKNSLRENIIWFYKRLGRYAEAKLLTQQMAQETDKE